MAFLCPTGFKKKGRPSHSHPDAYTTKNSSKDVSEVENLNLQAKLFEVVEDYYPCSALELPVNAGEIVQYISSEGSWLFVRTENGSDGYIPRRHCRVIENIASSNISRHPSELSDVGYYSDHIDDSRIRTGSRTGSRSDLIDDNRIRTHSHGRNDHIQNRLSNSHYHLDGVLYRRASEFSSFDEPRSSSVSPASTISSSFQHPKVRSWSETTDGLYSRENNEQYRPDASPYIQRYSRSHEPELKINAPICGRKCQRGCTHNRKERSVSIQEEQQANSKASGLHKSSVISVSSGKESSNQDSISSGENHRKLSQELKQSIINVTNNSLRHHKVLQQDLKHMTHQVKLRTKKHERKDRCQSAPVKLTKTMCGHPELIVIKEYQKQSETDITVDLGDFASIINDTKYKDWIYILNEQGEKGFVPIECVIKHNCQERDCPTPNTLHPDHNNNNSNLKRYSGDPTKYEIPDITKMMKHAVIENYSGRNLDDLYVCVGDFVYIYMKQQSIDEWYWVYSPSQKCSGYIPRKVVKDTRQSEQAKV